MSDLLGRTLGETILIETVRGGGLWQTEVDKAELEIGAPQSRDQCA